MTDLTSKYPSWTSQILLLRDLLTHKVVSTPPIYIFGPPGDSKSLMLIDLFLDVKGCRIAFVRCSECFWSRKIFYESILEQLRLNMNERANITPEGAGFDYFMTTATRSRYRNPISCTNWAAFVEHLKELLLESSTTEKCYIVLEDIEKIDSKVFGQNIISGMLRLEELVGCPIGVILIGSTVFEEFSNEFPVSEPLTIYLKSPSKDELSMMICNDTMNIQMSEYEGLTEAELKKYHSNFVRIVVDAMFIAFPSLFELQIICKHLFPKYMDPIRKALLSQSKLPDNSRLYSEISKYFKIVVESSSLMNLKTILSEYEKNASKPISLATLEFPIICKYLILSAWIASMNSEVDTEFLSRKRRKKSSKSESAKIEEDSFSPPKIWRLDKLLSILDVLLAGNIEEEEEHETATNADGEPNSTDSELADSSVPLKDAQTNLSKLELLPLLWESKKGLAGQSEILMQIGVLEQTGLFIRCTSTTSKLNLSKIWYQCGYDQKYAQRVADSIGFPLWGYL